MAKIIQLIILLKNLPKKQRILTILLLVWLLFVIFTLTLAQIFLRDTWISEKLLNWIILFVILISVTLFTYALIQVIQDR